MKPSRRGAGARRLAPLIALLVPVALALAFAGTGRLERADFVFNSGGEVSTLDPAAVTGVPEARIVRALFEGLCTRDPASLAPWPGVARSWDVSPDGRTYTFHLRPDALWTNGDPVTAQDFEWSFERLLAPETGASYASLLWCVTGAQAYTSGVDSAGEPLERDWKSVAIQALDASTLRIRLIAPVPYFLDIVSFHALSPVHRGSIEALRRSAPDSWQRDWLKPERLVSNGPFQLAERRLNDRIRLEKSPTYWDRDRVAFRTIDALAIERGGTALNLYLAGEIDWLDATLPTNLVPQLLLREDFRASGYFGSYFYRVNTTKPPLDDARVRVALAKAIPRREICDKILKAGQRPSTSIVPWGRMSGYVSPPGPDEGPLAAQELLELAGYGPKGKPFPPIEVHYNTGDVHRDIAEVIAAAWRKELGIDARLRNQEWKVYLDTQKELGYDVSRSSWIADYVDPSTFLEVWVSGNENNRTGWSNARYDELVARAREERNVARRDQILAQAESILLAEMPVLPIYSYVSQNLVSPRLGGFFPNPLNDQFPKAWYWRDDPELIASRQERGMPHPTAPARGPSEGLYAPAVLSARQPSPSR